MGIVAQEAIVRRRRVDNICAGESRIVVASDAELPGRRHQQRFLIGLVAGVTVRAIPSRGMGEAAGQVRTHVIVAGRAQRERLHDEKWLVIAGMGSVAAQAVAIDCRGMHADGATFLGCVVAREAERSAIVQQRSIAVMAGAAVQHRVHGGPQQAFAGGGVRRVARGAVGPGHGDPIMGRGKT